MALCHSENVHGARDSNRAGVGEKRRRLPVEENSEASGTEGS